MSATATRRAGARDARDADGGVRRPLVDAAHAMGLTPRSFGAPMDVWWFRLPRNADDPHGLAGVLGAGQALRRDRPRRLLPVRLRHPQGPRRRSCARRASRRCTAGWSRWCHGWPTTSTAVTSFDEVKLLDVQLNRLRRWYTDGLLLIGDAAHAMSPVGGVGINLAVADAVAAARRAGRPAARRHRLHQAFGPHAGPALGARRADPGGAAADPRRVIAVAVGRPAAGHTAAAGADRQQSAAAAHRGRIWGRDRPAARTRPGVCPPLTEQPADTHADEWTPGTLGSR